MIAPAIQACDLFEFIATFLLFLCHWPHLLYSFSYSSLPYFGLINYFLLFHFFPSLNFLIIHSFILVATREIIIYNLDFLQIQTSFILLFHSLQHRFPSSRSPHGPNGCQSAGYHIHIPSNGKEKGGRAKGSMPLKIFPRTLFPRLLLLLLFF